MLASMTGFGAARKSSIALEATVEVKSVNNRFLKLAVRAPASLAARESEVEGLLKERLRRGSVNVTIRVKHAYAARLVAIDEEVVRAYQAAFRRLGLAEEAIPTLP